MLLLLPLLAGLAAADSAPAPAPAAPAGELTIAVHRQPELPLIALRLALLADDPPGYAGAGHLFQHLLYPTLQQQAARVGGEVEVERSSDAIVYTVVGPAGELGYLAGILRGALRPPTPPEATVLEAERALAEERLGEWETAYEAVRSRLRERLFPEDLSAAGTDASAPRLTREALPSIWAALYRPERVSVTAVGDLRLADVRAAFADLPPRPAAPPLPPLQDTVALTPLAPVQATQGWLGAGYRAQGLDPAAVAVATRLLRDALRARLPGADVSGEQWWTHYGQAVALVVATPGPGLGAAERELGTAVATVRGRLSGDQVRAAATSIRRDILFFARTPDRMADVLGTFSDRGGDPDAAQRFLRDLGAVDEAQVAAVLAHFLQHTPVQVRIDPQKLPENG